MLLQYVCWVLYLIWFTMYKTLAVCWLCTVLCGCCTCVERSCWQCCLCVYVQNTMLQVYCVCIYINSLHDTFPRARAVWHWPHTSTNSYWAQLVTSIKLNWCVYWHCLHPFDSRGSKTYVHQTTGPRLQLSWWCLFVYNFIWCMLIFFFKLQIVFSVAAFNFV